MSIQTVHVLITGRVQGVWFRGWTREQATKLGLSGWIKNRSDGRVEALFCGDDENVRQMCALCRTGPMHAQVTDVSAVPAEPFDGEGFRVIRGD